VDVLDATDWLVIEALQEGIPLVERPYAVLAEAAGLSEAEFLGRLERLRAVGAIRRMGFRLRHHQAGVRGNIMAVWRVPEDRLAEVGAILAASDAVSHCYERPPFEGFPYNLYSMVHGASAEDAEATVRALAEQCELDDYRLLRSVREWKKSTPVYRRPKE
jgi:siroheme decarboxylase